MPVTKCFPVWICACVCLCVLVWPLLPVSLAGIRALAPRQRAPPRSAWHLRGPSGLGQHPGGSISSPRGGRRGGGSCSPGRHQRARVQRKTNPSALESMPTTHTHNATTWKQPTAVLQNHLISCTVYEGSSVGAASVLTLKRYITGSKSAFYEIEI